LRTKHKVTKQMPGLTLQEKYFLAKGGDLWNREAFVFACRLVSIMDHSVQEPELKREVMLGLQTEVLKAFHGGNGRFFRELGNAFEYMRKPIDRRRYVVLGMIGASERAGKPVPTVRQMQRILLDNGFKRSECSRRAIERIYRVDAERQPPKGRPGRPRNN
jgi:hypothetical protein